MMGNTEDEFDDSEMLYDVGTIKEEEKLALETSDVVENVSSETVLKQEEPLQTGLVKLEELPESPVTENEPSPDTEADEARPVVEESSAAQTISDLRGMLEEKYAEISSLKSTLISKQASLDKWTVTFKEEGAGDLDPAVVLESLQTLRASEQKLQEQVRDYKKRENALMFRVSAKEQEMQEVKTSLLDARQQSLGENKEVRRLLLDPVLHKEFTRLQSESQDAGKALRALQEELEAVKYSAESKNGRRLRARLQMWQKENEELAAQVSEGTVHHLECELALLKGFLTDLKRLDQELLEDAEILEIESMELNQILFTRPSVPLQEAKNSEGMNREKNMHSPPRRNDRDRRESKRSRS